MKIRSRLAILALASLALAASACQPPIFFPEIGVDTSDTFNSHVDDAVIGENGEFIVTWAQIDPDAEILGRRFDFLSVPLGDPFPINAVTTNNQFASSIARDASGRFVVVWSDNGTSIWGRRFEADGTPLGGNFQINTTTPTNTSNPHVASDPSGNFVAAWRWESATDEEVKARRFDSNGVALGDEFPVNVFTTGEQRLGGVAMSPAGFVVSWGGAGSGTANGIFARLFDPAGDPVTSDLHVHTAPLSETEARFPDTAMNAAGDFVVVWDDGAGGDSHAFGRRYDGTGAPLGDVFPINAPAAEARIPRVASDAPGNFVVAWRGTFNPPEGPEVPSVSAGFDIHSVRARLYDIGGFPVSPEFLVNQDTATGNIHNPRPSLAKDGSFVVAWTTADGGEYNVVARKTAVRAAPAIVMDPNIAVSSPSGGSAFGNGVFEPGETQVLRTAWVNDSALDVILVAGSSPLFTGPPGADYTTNDNEALYDTIPPGQTASCIDGADCYSVTVSNPAVRPVPHWDALFQETLSLSLPHTWVLHLGESFPDVPTDNQFYAFVETLFHNGVTGGCAGGNYCPINPVTRAQMAVFLMKAKFGFAHIPPPCTGTVFPDVPCTGGGFDPWIEELADLGITGGCGGGAYCPNNTVTRQQMAVFLLKALEGSAYDPPDCSGVFDDVPCTPGTGFSDWIEELSDRSITGGCSVTPPLYCPANPNNRGQMAVFLTKTFGLVLY